LFFNGQPAVFVIVMERNIGTPAPSCEPRLAQLGAFLKRMIGEHWSAMQPGGPMIFCLEGLLVIDIA